MMMTMPAQQRVGQRTEPHKAAAHRTLRQEKREYAAGHDKVWHGRTEAVEKGGCIGHRDKIGGSPIRCYRDPWRRGKSSLPSRMQGWSGDAVLDRVAGVR